MTTIRNFRQAQVHFNDNINRSRTYRGSVKVVRLQNNTVLVPVNAPSGQYGYAIRFHDTDVVTFWPDGRVSVETGGWLTVTTLDRLQTYLPEGFAIDGKVYFRDESRRSLTVTHQDGPSHTFEPGETSRVWF